MVLGSHANTRAMYSIPPWPSLAASIAAYRRRSFSDNHPKKRCIFSSISAAYTSMLDSLSQNLCYRKDTTAQACREVILDHILRGSLLPDCGGVIGEPFLGDPMVSIIENPAHPVG